MADSNRPAFGAKTKRKSRTPSAPTTKVKNVTGSMPLRYADFFQQVPEELPKDPERGKFYRAFSKIALARYGGRSDGTSAILRLALDELWRRRHEPTADEMQALVTYGIRDVIPDFDAADFSPYLADSANIVIATPAADKLLASNEHIEALAERIRMGRTTQILIPITREDDKGLGMPRPVVQAFRRLYRALPPETRNEVLAASTSERPMLALIGNLDASRLPARIFKSDDVTIVAPVEPRYHLRPEHPAIIYVPSKEPKPLDAPRELPIYDHNPVVRVTAESVDFHSLYSEVVKWAGQKLPGHNLIPTLWKAFETGTPQ